MKRTKAMTLALLLGACSGAEGPGGADGYGGASGTGTGGGGASAGTGGATVGGTAGVPSGGSQATGGDASQGGAAGTAGAAGGVSGGGAGGMSGGAGTGGGGAGGGPSKPDVAFCGAALDAAKVQLTGFRNAYQNPTSIPRSAKNGNVSLVAIQDWTSGFVAGSYWYMYEYTQEQAFRTAAEAWTAALEPQKNDKSHHDVGFQIMSSFGNGYRLTQNAAYLDVIKTGAASLMTRFREPVGAIQSWATQGSWSCPVIVDNMMNLDLLYFVTDIGGGASFAQAATKHADTTLTNHFRADNSSFHLVDYDRNTGAVRGKQTVQGLANDSAWARGQSWGLYGYVETYAWTQKPEYLAQAKKIAAFLMTHPNMPADKVPYWDYDAPDRQGAQLVRDASAAAIMASALLELSEIVSGDEGAGYRDYAFAILKSLASEAYAAAPGTNNHFLLKHSTGHLPANSEIDAAINYADYYYLEALLRCRALGE